MVRSPVLHPPNERLIVYAVPVTSIITHIIIGTIWRRVEVTGTTEETKEAVEEATAATAYPAVACARGASSRQDRQDRWRRWRFKDGQGGCVISYGGDHGKSGKIGEGHGIFGWPLRLRHVRPIIPGEHRWYSC